MTDSLHKKSPNIPEQKVSVDKLIADLGTLSPAEKARFLRKLVKRSARQPSELHFLRSLLQAVPVGSDLETLPPEISSKILANLDQATLVKMSRTNRRWWTNIWSEEQIWKDVLSKERLSEPAQHFYLQTIAAKKYSQIQSVNYALKFERLLGRNWSLAAPPTAPIGFECHGSHVITCMEIDPAGRYIITGSDDGTARMWNARDGTEVRTFAGHLGGVWALKVDWKRGLLVTGSTDRTLIVWSLWTGERKLDLLGHTSTVRCVELADGGRVVVSGSRDGSLRVWDIVSGDCLHVLLGHSASVRCLGLFRDDCVISGSYDNTCRIWCIRTGACLATLSGHTNKVYAVTATHDLILSGSLDGTVKIWDPCTGSSIQTLLGHRSLVGLVLAKPDLQDSFVVSGSTDGSLQLINAQAAGQGLPASHVLISNAHPSSITSLDFNRRFMISGSEGLVRLWSLPEAGGEPRVIAKLVDAMEMVWRVAVSESLAVVAYQLKGLTRLAIFNFAPTPEQVIVPLRKQSVSNRRQFMQVPLFGNVFHSTQSSRNIQGESLENVFPLQQQALQQAGQCVLPSDDVRIVEFEEEAAAIAMYLAQQQQQQQM